MPLHSHCSLSLSLSQVRHYAKKELSGYVRISIGKPEHTRAIIDALRAMA